MGIIRPILNPSPEEAAAIRAAFDAKSTSEPVVAEQRKNLSAHAPAWVSKVSDDSDLRSAMLSQLKASLASRIQVLEGYPSGPQRDSALERQRTAAEIVAGLLVQIEEHKLGGDDEQLLELVGDSADARAV
uniref:hypothetical protein n=1 Tax=Nocardia suismassiliense TaxID=2077092 RepID=UPI003F4999C1